MALQRNLVIGGLTAIAIGGLGYLARRARIHGASVLSLSTDTQPTARITWTYGDGALPLSVIIDLVAANGASGSATTDGEMNEATIPLSMAFTGHYIITTTATYRLLGLPNTIACTFEGTLPYAPSRL